MQIRCAGFVYLATLWLIVQGKKQPEQFSGTIAEDAKPSEKVNLDHPLAVSSHHLKEEVCGYTVRSTSDVPFRVVLTGVKGEADLVLTDDAQLDRSQTALYQLDLTPYTCGSGRHLGRKRVSVTVVAASGRRAVVPVDVTLTVENGASVGGVGRLVPEETGVDYVATCKYDITTPHMPFTIDALGIVHNAAALTQPTYEFSVERTECTDDDVPQIYNVKVTVTAPHRSPSIAVEPPVHDVQEEEHKQLTQPYAALQENVLVAEQARVKVAAVTPDSSMSKTSTAIIAMVTVGVVGFIVALVVKRVRTHLQRMEPEKSEMEWDNTEMKITLNPLDVQASSLEGCDEHVTGAVSDEETDSCAGDSYADQLSDLNDLDSSDNEDGHKDAVDLEWDNATLTFVEKADIVA